MSALNTSESKRDLESDAPPAYSVLPQAQPGRSEAPRVDSSREFTYNLEALKEDLLIKQGLHWNEDLQKTEAMIPANKNTLIPPFYVPIILAGDGAMGVVWLCLPRSLVVAARYANDNESLYSFTYKELESSLVAVKVSKHDYQTEPALNELKVLQELSKRIETADPETVPRFALPQAHSSASFGDGVPFYSQFWLAVRAVQPAMPLENIFGLHVTHVGDENFQILVLHVFCEVMESLAFIHGCSIVHNDIHGYNVLLELTDDLPVVCLIDFGLSDFSPDEVILPKQDYLQLRDAIKFGCGRAYNLFVPRKNEVPGWSEFINLINHGDTGSPESLLKSALPLAKKAIQSVTPQKRMKVANRLREFCRQTEGELLDGFWRLGLLSS